MLIGIAINLVVEGLGVFEVDLICHVVWAFMILLVIAWMTFVHWPRKASMHHMAINLAYSKSEEGILDVKIVSCCRCGWRDDASKSPSIEDPDAESRVYDAWTVHAVMEEARERK